MFDVQFVEAIAYALSREYVPDDEYYQQMTAIQRKQAVSIAGLSQIEQVKYVMNTLNKTLDSGGTFKEFKEAVKSGEIDIRLPDYRYDNIFRTNIQSAYNHGKWLQQERTKLDRPYRMYDAVNDDRTRPEHRKLDGIIRPIDDVWWDTHTPPLGYRCRCTTRSLTPEQAEKKGITPIEDLPEGGRDSEDWGHSPQLYNQKMEQVVNNRISELMLEYVAQSERIATIRMRIDDAIGLVLAQPIPELALLISEAEQMIEDEAV